MRRSVVVVATIIAVAVLGAADDGPLKVRIVSYPERIPLGIARPLIDSRGPVEGWVQVDFRAEVSNVGNAGLPIVPASFWGYPSDLFTIYAVARTQDDETLTPCRPAGFAEDVIVGRPRLEPGWTHALDVPVCLPGTGTYRVRVVAGETRASYVNASGEKLDLWTGSSRSEEVMVEVFAPEGIDREAYEAFGPGIVFDTRRHGELLRRFPTSTYAAYVVWKKTWPGTRPVEIESVLYSMERGPVSFGQTYLPCVDSQSPACRDMGYPPGGNEAARRQAAWIDLVLEHHPNLWFADELRFKKAYADYFLGDPAACAAGLEALAEHGRADVAAKARDLLSAMRAKGMLPGEGTE